MNHFRDTMRRNWEILDLDKIQDNWYDRVTLCSLLLLIAYRCCGDEPWLFRERWEKLFEDFCDVPQERFDPSRVSGSIPSFVSAVVSLPSTLQVSELYDTIKYCALHHRTFLFTIFGEQGGKEGGSQGKDRRLHELYAHAKALFDLVAPQEYGIEPNEKYFIPARPIRCLFLTAWLSQGGNWYSHFVAVAQECRGRPRSGQGQWWQLVEPLLHQGEPHPYPC